MLSVIPNFTDKTYNFEFNFHADSRKINTVIIYRILFNKGNHMCEKVSTVDISSYGTLPYSERQKGYNYDIN